MDGPMTASSAMPRARRALFVRTTLVVVMVASSAACARTSAVTSDGGGAPSPSPSAPASAASNTNAPPDASPSPTERGGADGGVDLPSLAATARGYVAAWTRSDADAIFAASTPAMQAMVWKSPDGLRRARADASKACGAPRTTLVDELFVIDAARAYFRHFAIHERARCETTVYLERASGKITGWLEWELPLAKAATGKAPADAREAGRAYVQAFDDGAIERVWDASSERMQREVWQSLGNLGGWRRTAMKTIASAGTPVAVREDVDDDHGHDRYLSIRESGGRRFRTELVLERSTHRILGWKTEPM